MAATHTYTERKKVLAESDAEIVLGTVEKVLAILEHGEPVYLGPDGYCMWPINGQRGERVDALFARFRKVRDGLRRLREIEGAQP